QTVAGTANLIRILRADGTYAEEITANAQDELVNARLYLKDGFSGIIPTGRIAPDISGSYPLVNGTLKKPGSVLGNFPIFNLHPTNPSSSLLMGDLSKGDIRYVQPYGQNPSEYF